MTKIRPMCRQCGTKPGRSVGSNSWRSLCTSCTNARYRKPRKVNLTCAVCGWTASDACQIDTVEGQSLCACCSRLHFKSQRQRELAETALTVDATVDWRNLKL